MATQAQLTTTWVQRVGGGEPQIEIYPEAASQSFKAGQLVYLVGGKVTVCANNAQVVLGIANQDATTATDADIQVIVLDNQDILTCSVYHSTAASAITAVAQVGEDYELLVSSNKCYCDIEATAVPLFRVVGIYDSPRYAVGDRYGLVKVRLMPAYCQTGTAG